MSFTTSSKHADFRRQCLRAAVPGRTALQRARTVVRLAEPCLLRPEHRVRSAGRTGERLRAQPELSGLVEGHDPAAARQLCQVLQVLRTVRLPDGLSAAAALQPEAERLRLARASLLRSDRAVRSVHPRRDLPPGTWTRSYPSSYSCPDSGSYSGPYSGPHSSSNSSPNSRPDSRPNSGTYARSDAIRARRV